LLEDLPVTRHFSNLTPKAEAFVLAFVENGGKGPAAARSAGYSPASARSMAQQLLATSKVSEAIASQCIRQLVSSAPSALAVVASLQRNAKSEYVRLEAAKDVLDRVGLSAPKRVHLGGQLSVVFDLS
jgi:phage terminase small subunit